MPQDLNTTGIQALKILPFFVFVIFYFTLVHDDTNPTLAAFLKCAPNICLMIFVVIKGTAFTVEYKYTLLILNGLLFSVFGDLVLGLSFKLFALGVVCYGVAHLFYLLAFDMEPMKLWKICFCIPFYVGAVKMNIDMFPYMDETSKIVIPVYSFLLSSMCWRSCARATGKHTYLASVSAFGCLAFFVSAGLFGANKFFEPTAYEKISFCTVLTYYIAQFCIALSTLDDIQTVSLQPMTA